MTSTGTMGERERAVDAVLIRLFPEWEADQRQAIASECAEAALASPKCEACQGNGYSGGKLPPEDWRGEWDCACEQCGGTGLARLAHSNETAGLREAAENVLIAFAEGVAWSDEQRSAYTALHAELKGRVTNNLGLAILLRLAEDRIVQLYDGVSKGHGAAFAEKDDVMRKIRTALASGASSNGK